LPSYKAKRWTALKKGDRMVMYDEADVPASEPDLAALGGKGLAEVGEPEII
jgi:hypothetical protein